LQPVNSWNYPETFIHQHLITAYLKDKGEIMKSLKLLIFFLLALVLMLTAGCGGGQKYTLECDIDTDHYGWSIDGEKGAYTSKQNKDVSRTSEYDPDGNLTFMTIEVDVTRTYEESGNSYIFVGEISLNVKDDTVAYHITATGETLPEPQTCQP
jgi:hypothetical protein